MNRLQDLREQKDLKEKDVAKFLNCSQQQISRMELNDLPTYVIRLIELSKIYDTSIDYILGLTDIKEPYPRANKKPFDTL